MGIMYSHILPCMTGVVLAYQYLKSQLCGCAMSIPCMFVLTCIPYFLIIVAYIGKCTWNFMFWRSILAITIIIMNGMTIYNKHRVNLPTATMA